MAWGPPASSLGRTREGERLCDGAGIKETNQGEKLNKK